MTPQRAVVVGVSAAVLYVLIDIARQWWAGA